MDPVLAKLLKEILTIPRVKPLPTSSKLGAATNHLIFQPYRWSESNFKFRTIDQKNLAKFQIIFHLATSFVGILNVYFQNNGSFADTVLQFMISILLSGLAFVIHFNQQTCVIFSQFLNGMLAFHKRSKVNKISLKDLMICQCIRLMNKTFLCIPAVIGSIAIILPESAFNPLAILHTFVHLERSIFNQWVIIGVYWFVQTVTIFFLWQAIFPLGVFSFNAILIYGIVSLRRSVQLCKR